MFSYLIFKCFFFDSLHLTTFCIEYKPTTIACVCIYVACLWAKYIIPETDEKNWYECIEPTCTRKQLEDLSSYFITILDSSPTRLKKKLTSGGAVVYKEGKVMQKNSSTTATNNNKTESSSSAATNEQSSSAKAISKNHLTGMLKPQSHESTPPPSSHRSSSHGDNRKHQEHGHNAKVDSNKVKDPKAYQKMQEQMRMEHKKKTLTPEQFEEYKRRKEREKQLYYQRKKLEVQQKDKTSNGASNISNKEQLQKLQGQKVNPQYKGSPAKRQKIENDARNHNSTNSKPISTDPSRKTNHDRLQSGFPTKHRPGLSSSGSESEPHGNKLNKNKQFSQSKTKASDNHHSTQPPATSRNSFNLPPPPPVATKYS